MSLSPTTVNTTAPSTSHSAHPQRPPMRNKSSSALSTHSSRTGTSSHSHTAHTAHRPKRNKSSSSLHSAGHHTVQFPHHGRKNSTSSAGSSKRSGSHSAGRKPAFGFGMTSLTSAEDHHHGSDDEDDHDEEEQERSGRRPGFDRRGSSGSTIVAAEQPRGRARSSDGRGSRSRSRAKSSPMRQTPESVEVTIQDVTPMATPPREEMRRPNEDNPQHLKKGGAIDKVVGSYQSTAGTGSDWESATDSPAPAKKKELPEPPRAYRQDTISGLGQVLGEGDRIASEEDARLGNETSTSDLLALQANGNGAKEEEKSRPTTPRRAKFEIDDSDDTSPPSPEALRQLQQLNQQPVDDPTPAVAPGPLAAETPFASEPQSPIKEHELKPVSPPKDTSKSAPSIPDIVAQQQQSTVPFPSSTTLDDASRSQSTTAAAAPPSPSHPHTHTRPKNTGRKSSNASLMSNASVRSNALSFAGRMGPPAPHLFRRTASSVAPPTVDRSACAHAEMAHLEPEGAERDSREGGSGGRKVSGGHRRTESLGSVASLRTVAEGGHVGGPTSPVSQHPKRAATLGVKDARDATRRLRQSTGSESSGALAALGNIQGGVERAGPPRRTASGYFSSALRGLTTQFPGLTPPLSPSASVGAGLSAAGGAGGRYPIPGASTPQPGAGASRGKQRASPSPAQFAPLVISKFIEPQDLIAPQQQEQQQQQQQQQQLSSSPVSSRFGPNARNASSASLSGGGAMSRTQQKALLARDAPYWSGSNTPNSSAPNGAQPTPGGSGYYNPNQPSTALHAPLPLPPPPATQHLSLTPNASQPQQYHQHPSQSAKMARTASGGTNSYPASNSSPAPGDQARQQGMQKWAYGLVREAERIERQYRAVEKWRDPLGESLERVMKARKERAGALAGGSGKGGANGVATAQSGAAVVAAKAVNAL